MLVLNPGLARFEGRRSVRDGSGWSRPGRGLMALVLLMIGLSAPSSGQPGSGPTPAPITRQTSQGQVELDVWGIGLEGRMFSQLTAEFERLHPEVHLRVQALPWGGAHEKLMTAVVGNMTPDVAQIGTTWMAEFAAMDALEPLNAFLASSTIREEDFFPGTLGTNRIGGVWYGLPWYVDTRLFFYRKDIVASAGFAEFPKTWDEFAVLCERLKAARPDTFPLDLYPGDTLHFMMFLWQRGGDILAENPAGMLAWPPAAVEETVAWLSMIRERHWIAFGAEGPADFFESFASGTTVMTLSGPWMIWEFEQKLPQLRGRIATVRLPRAQNGTSFLGGSNLVVFKNSTKKEWAWRLVSYLASREAQIRWFELSRSMPPLRAAWTDPQLASAPLLGAFREQLEEARSPPCVPEWELISDVLWQVLEKVLYREMTPASAPAAMEAGLHKVLETSSFWQPPLERLGLLLAVFAGAGLWLVWYLRPRPGELRAGPDRASIRTVGLFLMPALVLLSVFRFLPIVCSFLASLTNWDIYGLASLDRVMFVGLDNYRGLWADPRFWAALRNTLVFTLVGVPLNLILAMTLALALNRCLSGLQTFFRTLFFLPVVTTLVVAAIIWGWIFDARFGPANLLLQALGLPAFDWLGDPRLTLFSIVLVAVWKGFGYNMVIFFVGRQAIDEALYESAEIDGAGRWQQFRYITFPMMRRALLFSAVVTSIGFLQVFTEPYLMTGGGPLDSSLTLVLYLYQQGFRFFRVGYGSAVAMALFFCSLILLLIRSRLRQAMMER